MGDVPIIRRWGTFTTIVVAFNVILVVAAGVILMRTNSRFHDCLTHVPPLRSAPPNPAGLADCESQSEFGTALALLLLPIGILVDLAFVEAWFRRTLVRRRQSGIFSS
jgi:hypothetical protein